MYPNSTTLSTEIAYANRRMVKERFGSLTVYVSPPLAWQLGAGSEVAFTAFADPVEPSGPIVLDGHSGIAIPMITGRDTRGLSVAIRDGATHQILADLDPPPVRTDWWAWRPALPHDPALTLEISTGNKHSSPDRWVKIGVPHWLREPRPDRAMRPAVYRNGDWLATDGSVFFHLGQPGDVPVAGDWDASGKTRPGVYRPGTGEWILYGIDKPLHFAGAPDDVPVVGDWTGDGKSRPGFYKPATGDWILYQTRQTYRFGGRPGDVPIPGDWDATGKSKPGIYRPGTGEWLLYGVPGTQHFGGIPGDVPVAGDWNGDGRSKPGIFRRSSSWLLDTDGNYQFEDLGEDAVLTFGRPGDKPLVGQ
jgi:hypothetical protein